MIKKEKIAISIGDINGIGFEIAINAHETISKVCEPYYFIDHAMAQQAAALLGKEVPKDFKCMPINDVYFQIVPGRVSAQAGAYSYSSFLNALHHTKDGKTKAVVTMPIHKKAWELADITHHGHTDALRAFFGCEAVMALGCPSMWVGLFTEHIPLNSIPSKIDVVKLKTFLLTLASSWRDAKTIAVLGLNPHAGDNGVMGKEEQLIEQAIKIANSEIKNELFIGPLVPDTAFTPANRGRFRHYAAMYHDQGLIPLKALYFDESINVSLGLPFVRTSVDHGTAFDIAYKNRNPSTKSYENAITEALRLSTQPNIRRIYL